MAAQDGPEGEYTIHFNSYEEGGKVGVPQAIKVDAVIGADGANSRVAKEIDAGEYDYAIAFQVETPLQQAHFPERYVALYPSSWQAW